MAEPDHLQEVLQPFYQRASEAEERLAKLEAALANKKDAGNEELLKMVTELQSKLENAMTEQVSEREQALKEMQKFTAEIAKLKYRVIHLVRALKEADTKLASMCGIMTSHINIITFDKVIIESSYLTHQ